MFFHLLFQAMSRPVQLDFYGIRVKAHDATYLFERLLSFIKKRYQLCVIGAQEPDRRIDHGVFSLLFDGVGVKSRFPVFQLDEGTLVVHRSGSQFLFSQECNAAGSDNGV